MSALSDVELEAIKLWRDNGFVLVPEDSLRRLERDSSFGQRVRNAYGPMLVGASFGYVATMLWRDAGDTGQLIVALALCAVAFAWCIRELRWSREMQRQIAGDHALTEALTTARSAPDKDNGRPHGST